MDQPKLYIRYCKFCGEALPGATPGEPLNFDGKLWMFCCLEHKLAWDEGRSTVRDLSDKDWE